MKLVSLVFCAILLVEGIYSAPLGASLEPRGHDPKPSKPQGSKSNHVSNLVSNRGSNRARSRKQGGSNNPQSAPYGPGPNHNPHALQHDGPSHNPPPPTPIRSSFFIGSSHGASQPAGPSNPHAVPSHNPYALKYTLQSHSSDVPQHADPSHNPPPPTPFRSTFDIGPSHGTSQPAGPSNPHTNAAHSNSGSLQQQDNQASHNEHSRIAYTEKWVRKQAEIHDKAAVDKPSTPPPETRKRKQPRRPQPGRK